MIRNTAREIAVHLAYELSFTDKTVEELLDERLTKEYFDTLKDEDDIYEKAPGAADGIHPLHRFRRCRARTGAGRIYRQVRQGVELRPHSACRLGDHARCDV